MTLTVIRKDFKKFQPTLINYRSYKHFTNEAYTENLINKLSQENFVNNKDRFQRFFDIGLAILNKHAPCEIKHVRCNIKCLSLKQNYRKQL